MDHFFAFRSSSHGRHREILQREFLQEGQAW